MADLFKDAGNLVSKALLAGVIDGNTNTAWYETKIPFKFNLEANDIFVELDKVRLNYKATDDSYELGRTVLADAITAKTNSIDKVVQNYTIQELLFKTGTDVHTVDTGTEQFPGKPLRLTKVITENGTTWLAKKIFNQMGSETIGGWIMPPQVLRDNGNPSDHFRVRLFTKHPAHADSKEISLTDGFDATQNKPSWFFNYANGMLMVEPTAVINTVTGETWNDVPEVWMVGFKYIGKGAGSGAGVQVYNNGTDASNFVGSAEKVVYMDMDQKPWRKKDGTIIFGPKDPLPANFYDEDKIGDIYNDHDVRLQADIAQGAPQEDLIWMRVSKGEEAQGRHVVENPYSEYLLVRDNWKLFMKDPYNTPCRGFGPTCEIKLNFEKFISGNYILVSSITLDSFPTDGQDTFVESANSALRIDLTGRFQSNYVDPDYYDCGVIKFSIIPFPLFTPGETGQFRVSVQFKQAEDGNIRQSSQIMFYDNLLKGTIDPTLNNMKMLQINDPMDVNNLVTLSGITYMKSFKVSFYTPEVNGIYDQTHAYKDLRIEGDLAGMTDSTEYSSWMYPGTDAANETTGNIEIATNNGGPSWDTFGSYKITMNSADTPDPKTYAVDNSQIPYLASLRFAQYPTKNWKDARINFQAAEGKMLCFPKQAASTDTEEYFQDENYRLNKDLQPWDSSRHVDLDEAILFNQQLICRAEGYFFQGKDGTRNTQRIYDYNFFPTARPQPIYNTQAATCKYIRKFIDSSGKYISGMNISIDMSNHSTHTDTLEQAVAQGRIKIYVVKLGGDGNINDLSKALWAHEPRQSPTADGTTQSAAGAGCNLSVIGDNVEISFGTKKAFGQVAIMLEIKPGTEPNNIITTFKY